MRLSGAIALGMVTAAALHTGLAASGKSHLGVFWAKGAVQTGTLFERWNTYSRVRVTAGGDTIPFGWGFAHEPSAKIDQNYLDIDAGAGTVITHDDGDIGKFSYLKDDVINAAYLVQTPGDVAVVGVGGGRDILSALYFGARRVRASRSIPRSSKSSPTSSPNSPAISIVGRGVSLVNAEARSYINHSPIATIWFRFL